MSRWYPHTPLLLLPAPRQALSSVQGSSSPSSWPVRWQSCRQRLVRDVWLVAEGGDSGCDTQSSDSSKSWGSCSGWCSDEKVLVSLWQCPGCAAFLSHFPLSFLRDTDLGAFLCSPSEGLQLFSGFLSLSLLSDPWVCDANRFCSPILGLGMSWGLLVGGLCCSLFRRAGIWI